MDASNSHTMTVYTTDDVIPFSQNNKRLYVMDTSTDIATKNNNDAVIHYNTFLTTVKYNKQCFTNKEIDRADKAPKIQQTLGWPGTSAFKRFVQDILMNNCPITVSDINRVNMIYRSPIPLIKGKPILRKNRNVHYKIIPKVPLPSYILKTHRSVRLFMNFF